MLPETAARWTQIVGAISLLTSFVIAAGAVPALSGGISFMFDLIDWPVDGNVAPFTKEMRLLAGVCGGIFAGLSAMLIFVVAPALRRGDDSVRKGALIALLIWYVVDSAASVAAGAAGNAVINTLYLAIAAAPLVLLKKAAPQSP